MGSRGWSPVDVAGLQAGEFFDYLDFSVGKPMSHLDFAGAPLEFGYVTTGTCGVASTTPCPQQETTSALAAWHMTVHR